jgi:serine/threonine-protein kinase RsbW
VSAGDEITREARRENLAALLDFTDDACARAGLQASDAYAVRLAVEEVCANLIAHGYRDGPPGPVHLRIAPEPDAVVVCIADRAPPFDPVRAPTPPLDADWGARPIGGLGIYLVKQLMDEVRYESFAGGGNQLTLVKKRR